MRNFILFSFVLALILGCEKEPPNSNIHGNATGLVLADAQQLNSIPDYVPPVGGSVGAPSEFDLSNLMPPVGNQGSQLSCAAWAIGYYLQSYHQKIEFNTNYASNSELMSPAYLYNLGNTYVLNGSGNSCVSSGSNIPDLLDILKNTGVSSLQDFPYNPNNCSNQPSPLINSYENRIESYAKLYPTNPAIPDPVLLANIKSNIFNGNPVIIAYYIDSDWNPQNSAVDEIYSAHPSTQNISAHASLLVGYDNVKGAFKVVNSWGSSWANGGYFWIDYDFFIDVILLEAYVAEDYISPNTSNISAEFTASTPTSILVNQNVSFVDQSTGNPTSWLWEFQGGNPTTSTSQNPTVTYTTPGTYLVSLQVATTNGDTDTEIKQGYITVSANTGSAPVADFIANSTNISTGQSVLFSDLSTNSPTGWQWSFPGGSTSSLNTQNPVVTYNSPGVYNVSLISSNSFGSSALEEKVGYITVTSQAPTCEGTFTDSRDGQTYCYVTIGNQIWMAENLNYDAGAGSWCYDQTNYYCNQFGKLYSWSTVMNGSSATNQSPSGVQGICPNGWHVPSRFEYQELLDLYPSLTGNAAYAALIDGGSANFDVKLGGFVDLSTGNTISYFYNLNFATGLWTTSNFNSTGSMHYYLDFISNNAVLKGVGNDGFYCRCVKD